MSPSQPFGRPPRRAARRPAGGSHSRSGPRKSIAARSRRLRAAVAALSCRTRELEQIEGVEVDRDVALAPLLQALEAGVPTENATISPSTRASGPVGLERLRDLAGNAPSSARSFRERRRTPPSPLIASSGCRRACARRPTRGRRSALGSDRLHRLDLLRQASPTQQRPLACRRRANGTRASSPRSRIPASRKATRRRCVCSYDTWNCASQRTGSDPARCADATRSDPCVALPLRGGVRVGRKRCAEALGRDGALRRVCERRRNRAARQGQGPRRQRPAPRCARPPRFVPARVRARAAASRRRPRRGRYLAGARRARARLAEARLDAVAYGACRGSMPIALNTPASRSPGGAGPSPTIRHARLTHAGGIESEAPQRLPVSSRPNQGEQDVLAADDVVPNGTSFILRNAKELIDDSRVLDRSRTPPAELHDGAAGGAARLRTSCGTACFETPSAAAMRARPTSCSRARSTCSCSSVSSRLRSDATAASPIDGSACAASPASCVASSCIGSTYIDSGRNQPGLTRGVAGVSSQRGVEPVCGRASRRAGASALDRAATDVLTRRGRVPRG